MKDYSKIEEYEFGKYYLNENGQWHRLTGLAIEWLDGDKTYYINDILYMDYYKDDNKLYIFKRILKLNSEYEKYIKQNIKDLILEYNPKIKLWVLDKERINIPEYIKDLLII